MRVVLRRNMGRDSEGLGSITDVDTEKEEVCVVWDEGGKEVGLSTADRDECLLRVAVASDEMDGKENVD